MNPAPPASARPVGLDVSAPSAHLDPDIPGLFVANPVPMWICDLDSLRILAVNAAACALYGWTHDRFLQLTILDLREPDQHAAILEHVRKAPPGLSESGVWRHRRADGSPLDVEVTTHTVEFMGRSARFVAARDVTARAEAERALRESEARCRRIVESAFDGIWTSDASGITTSVNRAMEQMLGYEPGEMLGRHVFDFIPAEHRDRATTRFAEIKAGQAGRFEFTLLQKGGGTRTVRVASAPEFDEHGVYAGSTGWIVDLTHERSVEHALRASATRLELLLHGSSDAIFASDATGERFLFASPATETIFGRPPQEFVDRPGLWPTLVHPDEISLAGEFLQRLRTHGQAEVECRIQRADGVWRWVHARGWSFLDENKQLRLAASIRDVDERHEAEESIRRANVELEARVQRRTLELQELHRDARSYAYTVAHDLRAPLRVLQGFSQLLREDHGDVLPADARHLLQRIGDAALKLDRIVNGHLTLAHLERQELHPERVDVRVLVDELVRELTPTIEGRRVEFVLGALPPVRADATLLRQVFANLLSNAIKFSCERDVAHVEIGSSAGDGELVFFVRDDGIGFDPAKATELFTPFHRLDERYDGAGIGLATVQKIVARHGGRVWGEGAPGRGATFFFVLGPN